uniref:Uncharacterized protein n=1 Tax=Acrobeloides nanus TaxID=290746 RepID=A0A914C4F4_9BILA
MAAKLVFIMAFLIVVVLSEAASTRKPSLEEMAVNKGVCGGGCISSNQCASYDDGDRNCRCTWFTCKEYDKKTGLPVEILNMGY